MFKKGLKDVVAVQTSISSVDGERGILKYRGQPIESCINGKSFGEVAHYLWTGAFPTKDELHHLQKKCIGARDLPDHVKKVIDALPEGNSIMDTMRTAISAFGNGTFQRQSIESQSITLTAALPVIISRHYQNIHHLPNIEHDPSLGHVANYLWMLTGKQPKDVHIQVLESYAKLTMEHGMNASTFAGRVTISTESDLISAVVSAIGTMKGPLHGGAPSGVIDLLEEIDSPHRIQKVVENRLNKDQRIMGFGHRVYQTEDPRSIVLREICTQLAGKDAWIDLATQAEKEIIQLLAIHKPGRELYTNVEYYAAAIMRSIDLPPDLFTPTFSMARIVGWTAHAMEQLQNNTIFRPESEYIGQ